MTEEKKKDSKLVLEDLYVSDDYIAGFKAGEAKQQSYQYTKGYQAGQKKALNTLLTKKDVRLKRACELWCEWNRKHLDGRRFASKFGELFKDEVKSDIEL